MCSCLSVSGALGEVINAELLPPPSCRGELEATANDEPPKTQIYLLTELSSADSNHERQHPVRGISSLRVTARLDGGEKKRTLIYTKRSLEATATQANAWNGVTDTFICTVPARTSSVHLPF